jgi:hypothetical protein
MNELIKELAEQAGIQFPNNLVEGVNGPGVVSPKDKLAKFAELIVRECIEVANKNRTVMEIKTNTQLTADAIKKHFGVAE